jgi:hypothetical protein
MRHVRFWKHLALLAAAAVSLAGCISPGFHNVTETPHDGTVTPGLWRTLGGTNCSYAWTSPGLPFFFPSQIGAEGPQLVEIAPPASLFVSNGCAPWWQEPGPFARPLATPGAPFGPGDYQVGYEIAPGTYTNDPSTATRPNDCSWARLYDFTNLGGWAFSSEIQAGGGPGRQSVTIHADDRGFRSQHCGTWTMTPSTG